MRKALKVIRIAIAFLLALVILITAVLLLVPTTRLMVLGKIGMILTYYGFNEIGPGFSETALNAIPSTNGYANRALSVQNTKNGNYHFAIHNLEIAIQENAQHKEYYGWLLLYYYRDYERAYKILQEYDALTPNFSDAAYGEDVNYLKGMALMGMDKNEEAIQEFDTYIEQISSELDTSWVDVYAFVDKGNALSSLGEYEKAIEEYDIAIENYKECTEAYYFKAISLLKMDKLNKALENAEKANELIMKGYKHAANYIELFHEIYPVQTERLIDRIVDQMETDQL